MSPTNYLTTIQAAAELGMSPRRLREICGEISLSTAMAGERRLFTPADLDLIRAQRRPRGNPNFGPGFSCVSTTKKEKYSRRKSKKRKVRPDLKKSD